MFLPLAAEGRHVWRVTAALLLDAHPRSRARARGPKTASGIFFRGRETRARKLRRKSRISRRVAWPAATKSASGVGTAKGVKLCTLYSVIRYEAAAQDTPSCEPLSSDGWRGITRSTGGSEITRRGRRVSSVASPARPLRLQRGHCVSSVALASPAWTWLLQRWRCGLERALEAHGPEGTEFGALTELGGGGPSGQKKNSVRQPMPPVTRRLLRVHRREHPDVIGFDDVDDGIRKRSPEVPPGLRRTVAAQ